MKATSQPTNPASGKIIGDEAALERLFRANYATLVEDAKGKLGEPAATSAPRVVSKAFHQAWNDRSQFSSNEEVMAFLRAAIQHGSARELSRLAGLHRVDHAVHGSNHPDGSHPHGVHESGDMTVDEAWTRLEHTLHGTVPEAQRARASTARHEAAEHMQALGKKRNWWPVIGGGVLAIVAVMAVIMYFDRKGEGRRIDRALASSDVRNYDTRPGALMNVTLDDQTTVKLAPQTRLTIPKLFGTKMRAVKVDGAAQFNVTQTLDRPFQVHAGDVVVFAKGTKFSVRRYAEDSAVVVDVTEGAVDVVYQDRDTRSVAQGTALRVTDKGVMEAPSAAQELEATSWATDTVTVQERDLRYVLPQLKRFYALDIKVPDAKLLGRQVFLRAAINSPREAIASVEKSAGVKFVYVGDNMTFQDTALFKKKR